MKPPNEPGGKTARAICETTESVELGSACTCTARYETPRNSVIAITPSTASVVAAFFPCGWRNALTPFAIASTPVSAVEPDENARRRTKSVIAPVPAGSGFGDDRLVQRARSRAGRARPTTSTPIAVTNSVRRQREQHPRLAHAAQVREHDHQRGRRATARPCARSSDGANDVIAKIPAEIETATVST